MVVVVVNGDARGSDGCLVCAQIKDDDGELGQALFETLADFTSPLCHGTQYFVLMFRSRRTTERHEWTPG